MTPAVLATDSTVTIKDLLALFVSRGDLRPSTISVTNDEMVLHTVGGDSAVLAYSVVEVIDGRYSLETDQGQGVFVIENSKKARFNIAGAAYELHR